MEKREKVLVILMVAAIVIGGGIMIVDRLKPPSGGIDHSARKAEIQEVISTAQTFLEKNNPYESNRAILARASQDSVPDPFLSMSKEAFRPRTEDSGDVGQTFNFNGYIDIGQRKIAIIDGREYGLGDLLEAGGFSVADIKPDKVILRNKATGANLTVPYAGPSH